MAFIPISGTVPQFTENGNQADGMVLKFYEPGTLTPLAVGIDSTGVTQTTEFLIDIEGYTTLSGNKEIPHVDQVYKIVLYLDQADADANDTGSAVFVIDDVDLSSDVNEIWSVIGVTPGSSNLGQFEKNIIQSDASVKEMGQALENNATINFSSVLNMTLGTCINGNTIIFSVGDILSTGFTRWQVYSTTGVTPAIDFADIGGTLGAYPINALCIKDFGAVGGGLAGNVDDKPAIQSVFDFLTQYSTNTQNSGAFQNKVEIYFPDGDYMLNSGVSKSYRNSMRLTGPGQLVAGPTFTGTYMLELIACSHLEVIGLQFDGNSNTADSAVRVSGDGFTGVKRNSTNIQFKYCFFRDIGSTGANSYVVDTLSPNGIPGDFSIDDSSFESCNWLGSFGGALRLASSEVRVSGGKMSIIGVDNVNPVINLGNGSSLILTGVVFTSCPPAHLGADTGASIGRVIVDGCYNETTSSPFYSQTAGTCRALEIIGGYFSSTTGQDNTFVLFNSACKAQLSIRGTTFQRDGYKFIDLGESGSYIGESQMSTTSFNSFFPRVKNGIFSQNSMFIQTTQDGDKKRNVVAKYDQICSTKLQLFVGAVDDFTRLRFLTLEDALKYVDQSGYTQCEVLVFSGTHVIDIPFVFSGDLTIIGNGSANATIDIQSNIVSRGGMFCVRSATLNYINGAIVNRASSLMILGCVLTAASDAIFLVDHFAGDTMIASCEFVTAGSGVVVNDSAAFKSSGTVNYRDATFTNTNASAAFRSIASCRVMITSLSTPTTGTWPVGALQEADTVSAGGVLRRICTVAGTPGTWNEVMSAAP